MMKNENGKKEWSRPELTVLTRNKPEEAVLGSCKGASGSSPNHSYNNCIEYQYGDCINCSVQSAS